jgi:hypothetical protein
MSGTRRARSSSILTATACSICCLQQVLHNGPEEEGRFLCGVTNAFRGTYPERAELSMLTGISAKKFRDVSGSGLLDGSWSGARPYRRERRRVPDLCV